MYVSMRLHSEIHNVFEAHLCTLIESIRNLCMNKSEVENAVNNAFCYNELTSFIYLFDNQNTTTMTMFVQKQFEKIQAAFASKAACSSKGNHIVGISVIM